MNEHRTSWRSLGRVAVGLVLTCAGAAFAQANYPARPIRVVVPYSAGGNTDIVARDVMKEVSAQMGQPIVIDNKPGANSILGTDIVAKASPDGYTLGLVIGAYANNATLYRKLPYGPDDLTPVSQLTKTLLLLVTARPDATSYSHLVKTANSASTPLTYATSGVGSQVHLFSERMAHVTGMKHILHVPYKGTADTMADVVSGRVGFMIDSLSTLGPHIQTGKVRALVVTGQERSPLLPEVPTLKELGYPELVNYSWNGVVAPAGTPVAIVERLSREIAIALKKPALRSKLAAVGAEAVGNTPTEFGSFIAQERKVNGNLIRQLGLTLE
ncbi:tripartite tricarboxylate transporter substrate binding protein [Ottowia sp. GY511]|uniref:Bug family tripartite tricarboxylate transporter substrate binding protein n=1 Tax=Ottowia flava TaxID=2675430 RepID=A0ABW4KVR7_9BURK|nr:tripartite tricarboxylate transporter substrate-binding protein [Ottowia sp. GY511]TXK31464.1 tripartite tricarboxylate transporter substrate binding protein [Ottowia sp. GY511]